MIKLSKEFDTWEQTAEFMESEECDDTCILIPIVNNRYRVEWIGCAECEGD